MSIRILIAEDNPMNSEILCRRLEKRGFDVQATFDGLETLKLLENNKFDVLLLDLDMPLLDGDGVLLELKKKNLYPDMRIIILSAFPNNLALQTRIYAYLPKPIPFEQLLSALENFPHLGTTSSL